MPYLILTLIGPDRPGLVDAVAHLVTEHHGNWLESRMAHLAGHFAGIVRVEIAQAHTDSLIEQLELLETSGLSITIRKDDIARRDRVPLVRLHLIGNDRPGIVSEVSHELAVLGVNVEEFHTECVDAPNSGSTLFEATAMLQLPPTLEISRLQSTLEGIALDLMVDIQLERDE